MKQFSYSLLQDGYIVAQVQGANVWAEICHYAMMYGQDGPVEIVGNNNASRNAMGAELRAKNEPQV